MEPGRHWTWLSVALYGAACLLPALPPIMGDNPIPGWVCLTSLFYTFAPWWANPAYFLSLIFTWKRWRRAAVVLAIIAAILACSYEVMEVQFDGWVKSFLQQEVGCYVWIASMQIHAINLAWQEWLDLRQKRDQLEARSGG